jgi:Iap family predicted aminopeptidase
MGLPGIRQRVGHSARARAQKGHNLPSIVEKHTQMVKLSFPITEAFVLQLSSVSERFSLSLSSLRVSDHRSTRVYREFARVLIGYITFAQPRRCIFVWFPIWNLLRRGPNLPGENSLVSLLVEFGARFFMFDVALFN